MSIDTQYQGIGRYSDADEARRIVDAKQGQTVTVCIPAHDDSSIIGEIVRVIVTELVDRVPIVDEVIVMDNGSTDDTAEIARRSGARVVSAEDVAAELGPALGKGDVLWRSLQVASGDIVVWLDGDLSLFTPRHVTKLVSPLLEDDRVVLVRAIQDAYEDRMRATDGHVADLTARPALKLLFPELAHIRQPLGGEQAVRRANVLALPFEVDEGGSVGLLIDVSRRFGPQSIRQVDLGARRLRIRPLEEAYEHARQVLRAILSRAHGESMTSGSIQRPAGASWLAIAHNKVALPERERTVTRKVSGTGPLRLRLHFSVVAGHERKDEGLWHGETLA